MELTSILIGWLQRRYINKIDRYLAHLDGVYCVEYAGAKGAGEQRRLRGRAPQRAHA